MRTGTLERLTGIAGLVVVGLFVVSVLLSATPPAADAPAQAFAAHAAEKRTAILVTAYLAVLSSAITMAFLAGLRDVQRRLDERGESTLATVGLAAGILQFSAVVVGVAVLAAAAYRPGLPGEVVRTLTDTGWIVINLAAGLPTAVSVAAFSIVFRRSHSIDGRVVWLGFLVALAHLVVAAAFARRGFLAPEGLVALLVPALYYAWVLGVSVALLGRRAPAAST
jgi:hypothetical protein